MSSILKASLLPVAIVDGFILLLNGPLGFHKCEWASKNGPSDSLQIIIWFLLAVKKLLKEFCNLYNSDARNLVELVIFVCPLCAFSLAIL